MGRSQGGKVTFREYAKTCLTTKADVSERTLRNIIGRLNNYSIPHFGDMAMSTIRPSDVRSFVANINRAPATVKAIYLTTSQVFDMAVLDGVISQTPCRGIALPSDRNHEEMHFLTPDQVDEIAGQITSHYYWAVLFAAYSGLRCGEQWALKVADVELGELGGRIHVNKSACDATGRFVIGPTKTGTAQGCLHPALFL